MTINFPEDKSDFKAENGMTYTWEDNRWRVKSYGSETSPPLTYQIQTDKILRAGEPAIELVDSEGYFSNVKFESDGLISVDSNAASIVVSSEQIEEQYDGVLEAHDERLDIQSDQINLIETQIQLLAKAQAVGKWKYVRNISGTSIRPPATTTFYGTHQTSSDTVLRNWSDLRMLMVDKTDLEGTEYAFTNFEEGDKIEILDTDGSSACYGTLTNNPTQETYGNMIVAVERANGGPRDDKEYILSVYRPGAVSGDVDLDILDERYLRLTGGTLESALKIQRGADKTHPQYKISPNGGADYATNIYTYEGQMRFRTSHTESDSGANGSHIVLDPDVAGNGANPSTKIWKVATPTSADMAANKAYVDEQIAAISVPVGSIMIWLASAVPDGWFKLQGGNFDTSLYPKLHTYLLTTDGYTAGKLPDWKGHYPGEYGDHLAGVSIGKKLGQRTAMPSGGAPTTSNLIPNGNQRTFTATGNTNAYSNGIDKASISEGWDNDTRPKTVVVHYIIKHD